MLLHSLQRSRHWLLASLQSWPGSLQLLHLQPHWSQKLSRQLLVSLQSLLNWLRSLLVSMQLTRWLLRWSRWCSLLLRLCQHSSLALLLLQLMLLHSLPKYQQLIGLPQQPQQNWLRLLPGSLLSSLDSSKLLLASLQSPPEQSQSLRWQQPMPLTLTHSLLASSPLPLMPPRCLLS
jgi:hypothetical protein